MHNLIKNIPIIFKKSIQLKCKHTKNNSKIHSSYYTMCDFIKREGLVSLL